MSTTAPFDQRRRRWMVGALGVLAIACQHATAPPPAEPQPSPDPPTPSPAPGAPSAPLQLAVTPSGTGPSPPPGAAPAGPPRPASCGRGPTAPLQPAKWWTPIGSAQQIAECDQAASVWANVPAADRACQRDSDCVPIVANGHCFRDALNRTAASKRAYDRRPCGDPRAGACPGPPEGYTARCQHGCCVVLQP